jgi:hypothetical protein
LAAVWTAARQRDHVGVVVLVEKQKTEIKSMPDLEIGSVAGFAVPAFRGDLRNDAVPVGGDQADQLRAHWRVQISTSLA